MNVRDLEDEPGRAPARESGTGSRLLYSGQLFDRPATTRPCPVLPGLAAQSKTEEKNLKNIFVGNLDFGATESGIRAMFEQYGRVDRVNL
jgi:hypothetical protein